MKKSKGFFANLHDKTEYVIHRKKLKQALNHALKQKLKQNFVIWAQTASLFMWKQITLAKTLQNYELERPVPKEKK